MPLGKSASAQLQQPEPLPPPFYQLLPRLKQHLIKSFSQAESVWTPGDTLRALPCLGGTEMIARIIQDQKSRGRYPTAHTHRDLEALGQPWLWNIGVVLGKSLLPTLSRPSQRCLFDLSCRTVLCLLPFTAKLVLETLFTGHHCHTGTPAHAACQLPGTWHQPHVHGTDKGLPNRMPGA